MSILIAKLYHNDKELFGMPSPAKIGIFALLCLSLCLSACITLPGHRVIVDEENYYLHVETPSKQVKNKILFNDEETALLHLPEQVQIKLIALQGSEEHKIKIRNKNGEIVYQYMIDGKRVDYEPYGKQWFASQTHNSKLLNARTP